MIWPYTHNPDIYVCPEYPLLLSNSTNSLYGFPPQWTYVANGQPGYSMNQNPAGGAKTNGWPTRIDRIQPNPQSVFMLYEQSATDFSPWNDGLSLFNATYTVGDDSLGYYHNNGGNLAFYDGHVEWKPLRVLPASDEASTPS